MEKLNSICLNIRVAFRKRGLKKIASGKRNNVKEKKNEEESSINYGGSINGCESWGVFIDNK